MTAVFEELAAGLRHPEGVAWNPFDGRVYAGGEDGEIYAVTLEGAVEEIASTGGSLLGVAVDGTGRVYACDAGKAEIVRLDPEAGSFEVYVPGPLDTPNMLCFDDSGNLFVTCSGEDDAEAACVMRATLGGRAEVWTREPHQYPNGCCLTPQGDALIVVESRLPGIRRVPVLPDGSAGKAEVLALLPETEPDGVAFDAEGSLYVTLYRPDGILRLRPDGTTEWVISDPLAHTLDAPTNLAFVGETLDAVVIANVGDTYLSIGRIGARGLSLRYPEVA
jgi:gluconolactonase